MALAAVATLMLSAQVPTQDVTIKNGEFPVSEDDLSAKSVSDIPLRTEATRRPEARPSEWRDSRDLQEGIDIWPHSSRGPSCHKQEDKNGSLVGR